MNIEKCDPSIKLTYAFEIYDEDKSGFLSNDELIAVIYGLSSLLEVSKKGVNSQDLARECMIMLDKTKNEQISKEDFVNGLLSNENLRKYLFDDKL